MAKKGEKQSPEYIAKRMASWKETRRKKGLPVSDDLVDPPLCACGCGQKVHKHPEKMCWYKYINGHNKLFWVMYYNYRIKQNMDFLVNKFHQLNVI